MFKLKFVLYSLILISLNCRASEFINLINKKKFKVSFQLNHNNKIVSQNILDRSHEVEKIFNIVSKNKVIPDDIKNSIIDEHFHIQFVKDLSTEGIYFPPNESPYNDGFHLIQINRILLFNKNLLGLISHELFHGIHYILRPNEPAWLREGLAQNFEQLITGHVSGKNLKALFNNPTAQLMGNYELGETSSSQYAQDMMFIYYLLGKCGGKDLFWSLAKGNPEDYLFGKKSISKILNNKAPLIPICSSLKEVIKSYKLALHQNKVNNLAKYPQLYFLYPTSRKVKNKEFNSDTEIKSFWKNAPIYTSIEISTSEFDSINFKCADCSIFFLQKSFPYKVKKASPVSLERWKVLLFKNK